MPWNLVTFAVKTKLLSFSQCISCWRQVPGPGPWTLPLGLVFLQDLGHSSRPPPSCSVSGFEDPSLCHDDPGYATLAAACTPSFPLLLGLALVGQLSQCQLGPCHRSLLGSQDPHGLFSHPSLDSFLIEILQLTHLTGKQTPNVFTAASCIRGDGDVSNPAVGFKSHLVRLIGNLCYKNTKNQDKVGLPGAGGVSWTSQRVSVHWPQSFVHGWGSALDRESEGRGVTWGRSLPLLAL